MNFDLKQYSRIRFNKSLEEKLKEGMFIKFYYGISENPEYQSPMIGKILKFGFSKKYNCRYCEVYTKYGYYVTTFNRISAIFVPKFSKKIIPSHNAICISNHLKYSDELPYMITVLEKLKEYISNNKLAILLEEKIKNTADEYKYELIYSYPKNIKVHYLITDKFATTIKFQKIKDSKIFSYTFKLKNKKGEINVNYQRVIALAKRFSK